MSGIGGARGIRRTTGAMVCALVLGACGGDDDQGGSGTAGAPSEATPREQAQAPSGDATRVDLDEFSFKPSEVTVERGDRLEAVNVGDTAHNLTIERDGGGDEAGDELAATETFPSGDRRTLEADVDPGRYSLVCTVPGHREAGMVGEIRVR